MGWVFQRQELRLGSGFQMFIGNNTYERQEAEEDWVEEEVLRQSKRELWN